MATVTQTVELPVSLNRVWRLLVGSPSTGSGTPRQGLGRLVGVHAGFPDGAPHLRDIAPGVSFRERVQFMGMPAEIVWTVAEWEPPESIVMNGVGPMGSLVRVAVRAGLMEGGVRWTHEVSFGGGALTGMLPMLEKQIRTMLDEFVAGLRTLLGEPAPA
jgi:hypothetical protein